MALNYDTMADSIVTAMVDHYPIPGETEEQKAERKAKQKEAWIIIAQQIVEHIQNNAEVSVSIGNCSLGGSASGTGSIA